MQTQNNKPSIYSEAFLKREKFIRTAGWLMALSPAGNFFWTAALAGNPNWYMPYMLIAFAKSVPPTFWFLWISAFAVGCMMIAGKKSPWKLTLGILSINLAFGLFDLKHDLQFGMFQPILSLVINLALGGLIYFQEFHRKIEFKKWQEQLKKAMPSMPSMPAMPSMPSLPKRAVATPAVETANLTPTKNIPVVFDGIGEWAMLLAVTQERISLRSTGKDIPADIERRLLSIALSKTLQIQARFSGKNDLDYHFEFIAATDEVKAEIEKWQKKLIA